MQGGKAAGPKEYSQDVGHALHARTDREGPFLQCQQGLMGVHNLCEGDSQIGEARPRGREV